MSPDSVPFRRFEALVVRCLDDLPAPLAELLDNVVILVEDEHPDEPDLLGLYDGTPLTERGDYGYGEFPDQVTIYRLAHLAECESFAELTREVRTTIIHELSHHIGVDDERLAELGWA